MSSKAQHPLSLLTNLGDRRYGSTIVFATDDWFAPAECMLRETEPLWVDGKFTSCGKWMDGWESRRKRIPGHDMAIVKLGLRGRVRGLLVDTCFFSGNYAPRVSVEALSVEPDSPAAKVLARLEGLRQKASRVPLQPGANPGEEMMGQAASAEMFKLVEELNRLVRWQPLLARTEMRSGAPETRHHFFEVNDSNIYTHIRLNMYPDGGIARFKVFGDVVRDWSAVPASQLIDLAAAVNGGTAVAWSDAHYGIPSNMIGPGKAANMGDGWETARKKGRPAILEIGPDGDMILPGNDWAVLRLACTGTVKQLEILTDHFKGNFPESCTIEGTLVGAGDSARFEDGGSSLKWITLVKRVKLQAHKKHVFDIKPDSPGHNIPFSHIRLTIYPDGGISRLRVLGYRQIVSKL